MAWFPSNNHPQDKATYDFRHRADGQDRAGQRRARVLRPTTRTARRTWQWHMGYPMETATDHGDVGDFDLHRAPLGRRRGAAALQRGIDSSYPTQKTANTNGDRPAGRRSSATSSGHLRARTRSTPVGAVVDNTAARASATCSRSRRRSTSPARRNGVSLGTLVARDRAPVVRRHGLAGRVERHLAQRGLGDLVQWD